MKGDADVAPANTMKNLILKFLVFIATGALLGALAGYVQQCTGGG